MSFFVVVVVVPSFGNTEGTVEWDYYYGENASTESEAGPVDTKVENFILFSIIMWLNPQAGNMKRNMLSDWLLEQAKWACLACSRFFAFVPHTEKNPFWPYGKSFIDQACLVKDGMILASGFLQRFFFNSTSSRSLRSKKTNLANNLPS